MSDFIDITTAVKKHLTSDVNVSSLVNKRIEIDWYPSEFDYPGIVIHLVSSNSVQHLGGNSGICNSMVQIDTYGLSATEARKIDEKVRLSLMNPHLRKLGGLSVGRVIDEGKRDIVGYPLDGSQKWRSCRQHDFTFFHEEEIA